MIGAEGLLGKSWPDLDMLPLGWLTDPGDKKICRLCSLASFHTLIFIYSIKRLMRLGTEKSISTQRAVTQVK